MSAQIEKNNITLSLSLIPRKAARGARNCLDAGYSYFQCTPLFILRLPLHPAQP